MRQEPWRWPERARGPSGSGHGLWRRPFLPRLMSSRPCGKAWVEAPECPGDAGAAAELRASCLDSAVYFSSACRWLIMQGSWDAPHPTRVSSAGDRCRCWTVPASTLPPPRPQTARPLPVLAWGPLSPGLPAPVSTSQAILRVPFWWGWAVALEDQEASSSQQPVALGQGHPARAWGSCLGPCQGGCWGPGTTLSSQGLPPNPHSAGGCRHSQ